MKLKKMFVALALLSPFAQATSLHPDTFRETAKSLRPLEITRVAKLGKILKKNQRRPYTNYIVSIPATVNPGNACTEFVGQTETQVSGPRAERAEVTAIGASDRINDACIAVMPRPVETNLTLGISVLTGGFVPAEPIQHRLVRLHGAGLYRVTLDMANESVSINPVGHR